MQASPSNRARWHPPNDEKGTRLLTSAFGFFFGVSPTAVFAPVSVLLLMFFLS
jgi:hypothetical protein